ncbi:MAG: branched-chain amino acid ABC transporter permease [Candidatus Kariarchaeaceae archaeon]
MLSSFFTKLREENDFQSIIFLLIAFPVFFIGVAIKYNHQTTMIIIINGATQGSFYALIAIGFSIIFGIARMFKLSLGGYFVLGAYVALWLRKMTETNSSSILNAPLDDFNSFNNKMMIFIPLIIFLGGLVFLTYKLNYIRIGIIFGLTNLIFFGVQRNLIRDNYPLVIDGALILNQALFHALLIQMSLVLFSLALFYLELSPRQIVSVNIILNILMTYANTFSDQRYSPALYFATFLITVILIAGVSMIVDRFVLDKIRSDPTIVIIITFGIALLLQSLVPLLKFPENGKFTRFGVEQRDLPGLVVKSESMDVLGESVQTLKVVAFIASIILVALVFLFVNYTRMGKAMRAVAQDAEAAWLTGINVQKVYLVVTGLGMGLAAAAAFLTTPYEAPSPGWTPYMGWIPLIFAIAVVTLGGLGSISGSVIAGFIVGYTEVYIANENVELSSIVPLLVIFAVLLIRPSGLFGLREEEE